MGSEEAPPTVTVEQHRLMAEKGIKVRQDVKYGFKKRCAREDCLSLAEGNCYCAPTLEEALVQVEQRSAHYCSRTCGMKVDQDWNTAAWEHLQSIAADPKYHTVLEASLFGIVQKTLSHHEPAPPPRMWWTDLDHRLADLVLDVFGDEMDEWDPSDGGDDDECPCDLGGSALGKRLPEKHGRKPTRRQGPKEVPPLPRRVHPAPASRPEPAAPRPTFFLAPHMAQRGAELVGLDSEDFADLAPLHTAPALRGEERPREERLERRVVFAEAKYEALYKQGWGGSAKKWRRLQKQHRKVHRARARLARAQGGKA